MKKIIKTFSCVKAKTFSNYFLEKYTISESLIRTRRDREMWNSADILLLLCF